MAVTTALHASKRTRFADETYEDEESQKQVALSGVATAPDAEGLASPTMELKGHKSSVTTVRFHPTQPYLLSASADQVMMIWSTVGKCNHLFSLTNARSPILDATWSLDGTRIYTCDWSGLTRVYDTDTLALIRRMQPEQKTHAYAVSSSYSTTASVSVATDAGVFIYDTKQRFSSQSIPTTCPLLSIACTRDGTQCFVSGIDQCIKCFDLRTLTLLYEMYGHTDIVTGLTLNSADQFLLSTSADATVRCWDVRPFVLEQASNETTTDKRLLAVFRGSSPDSDGNLLRCDFSPDSSLITSGSADGAVNIWEGRTGLVRSRLGGHRGAVTDVRFHPTLPYIASASVDRRVLLGNLS